MKVKSIISGLLISIGLGVGAFLYWSYITSPQYSLKQLNLAFKEHDTLKFEKYFDTQSVVESLVDQMMETADPAKSDSEKIGEALGKGLISVIKPQIVTSLKKQINKYIEVGNFGENKDFSLENFWKKTGASYLTGIKSVREEGKIAEVIFPINHKRYNQEIDLNIKMKKQDNYWQVVDFSNLSEFLKKIDELENEKIKQLNENIIKEIDGTIKVSDCFKSEEQLNSWGTSNIAKINCNISNISQKDITDFSLDIRISDNNNKINKKIGLSENSDKSLLSQNKKNWFWNININQFIDEENLLFQTSTQNLYFNPDIHWIKFSDGMVLKPYERFQEINSGTNNVNTTNQVDNKINTTPQNNVIKQENTQQPSQQTPMEQAPVNKIIKTEVNNKTVLDFSNSIFSGSIDGKYKIHMNLTKIANNITGTYYYDIYKTDIRLSGSINNYEFVINEFDPKGKGYIIGIFNGKFTGSNSISGIWSKPDNSKSLPFSVNAQ